MKLLLIISFSFFINLNSFALSVISDLDDTLKVTNVKNFLAATRNALFSKKAFGGVPSLLEEFSTYTTDLYIVTASPKFLNSPVRKFLRHNKIDTKKVVLRNLISERNKKQYKIESIKGILEATDNETFILIGDNTELDAEIYLEIKRQYPARIAQIYIRKIKDTKMSKEVIPFYTVFDIALSEFIAGRMNEVQVYQMANPILEDSGLVDYLPYFAFCPKMESDFRTQQFSPLNELSLQVRTKIISYCSARF